MAIRVEFEKKEIAIELPDGIILEIPERTKAMDDSVQEILQKRESKKEFDFLVAFLEVLFGKDSVKKIVPDAKTVNLDYLTAIYTTAVNAFYADKLKAEEEEMQKKLKTLEPLTDQLKAFNPVMSKLK